MENKPELPLGWKWVRLGEVCEKIQYGLTATATDNKDGFPFIRITDIDDLGNIKLESMRYTYCDEEIFRKYELKENDILFARTGSIGRTFLYNGIPSKAIFASYLIRFRPKKDIVDPLLLFYYSHSPSYFKFIGEKKHTVSQPNINAEEYKSLPIPLPPFPEQKRIAAKLQEMMQEIDQARTACEKQLEAAKSLPSAYLREVFENPEAKKWERKKLGEVIKSTQSGTWGDEPFEAPKEEVYIVIRSTEIDHKGVISIKDEKVAQRRVKPETARKYFLKPNDLLVVRSGGTTGKIILGRVGIYLGEPDKYLFSNFLLKAQVDEKLALPEFLWRYLNWNKFLEENIPNLMRRTTGIQNLPMDEYFSILIPLPPLLEQKRIASYLKEKIDQAEKLRASIEKQLEIINALPQAILSKAFKGEI